MAYSLVNRRILIIEDNPGDLILVQNLLREKFDTLTIEHAATFSAAKQILQNVSYFDAIILDLSLPDAGGDSLINEMIHLAGNTPIILLTGFQYQDYGITTLALGIADYLLKDELTAVQLSKSITYGIERSRINLQLIKGIEKYDNLFNLSPTPMWVYDVNTLKFLNVNAAAIKHYGYCKADFLNMTLYDIRPPEDHLLLNDIIEKRKKQPSVQKEILRHLKKDGEIIDVELDISEQFYDNGNARLVISNDISINIFQQNILAFEKDVYALNARPGIDFAVVLNNLLAAVEKRLPGAFCNIVQKDGEYMHIIAPGSMPQAYLDVVEGLLIRPADGSCGPAIHTGQPVIVIDIDTHPLWDNYRPIIQPLGFKACWSVPVKKSDGSILGSFATYFKTIKIPLVHQLNLLERAAKLVGILIENKNSVDAITKSNERSNIITKATSDMVWEWNLYNDTIFWNNGVEKILGYDDCISITNKSWWEERIHHDDSKKVLENWNHQLENKLLKRKEEYRFLCADGTYKYIYDTGFLVMDKNNNPIKLIGTLQDITKQKEEEHQLKLMESVIINTHDAVLITEAEPFNAPGPRIIYVNEAFSKMTGYTMEELVGKTPRILQGPKTDRKELARLTAAMKKWEPCEITTINYKKTGEEFWINLSISPVADDNGWFTHWIAIERDITANKKKDQEVTKAIIAAQEMERFQIGGELHDNVNQILAGVLLKLGMAKGKPTVQQDDWIDQSLNYVRTVIDEIRKLSHRLAPASIEETSLNDSIETLLKTINVNNQYQIIFTTAHISQLQLKDDIKLNIYRILQEQLSNILKYAEATIIKIELQELNNQIHLTIADNGIGFDTNNYIKGIGLNNIKKRVELFSGSFNLKSLPGEGCEITIEIPLI